MEEFIREQTAAALRGIGEHLAAVVQEAASGDGDLSALEPRMERCLRGIGEQLATACVNVAARRAPVVARCTACGSKRVTRSQRDRRIVTSVGEARYRSVRTRCNACRTEHYPFETRNDLVGNRYTVGARLAVAEEAASLPYARAAQKLDVRGIPVSPREVDRISREVAEWRSQDEHDAQVESLSCKHVRMDEPVRALPSWQEWRRDEIAVLSVDGAQVRGTTPGPDGSSWFECRVGLIVPADDRSRAHAYYTAGILDPTELFRCLRAASQSDERHNRPAIFIADGAPWIWNRAPLFFPRAIQVLDIYHAAAHVATGCAAIWGEGSQKAQHWRCTARQRLLQPNGPRNIIALLQRHHAAGNAADPHALATVIKYLNTHRSRMPYHQLKQQGLPVGSGVMESAIKQVATTRLRGPGMKWTREGANSMLTLRSAMLSNTLRVTAARHLQRMRADAPMSTQLAA